MFPAILEPQARACDEVETKSPVIPRMNTMSGAPSPTTWQAIATSPLRA
jgi:hypothetical protein